MKLKVFVSSTCYDLSIIRSQLKSFIERMGYDAVLSEYNDIFFNPHDHTHESCVKEVSNADVVILIIGSRFGGQGIPSLKSLVDFTSLTGSSYKTSLLENNDKLSVTQYEILKAVEEDIPVYCFVEEQVFHDHLVYEKNKGDEAIIKRMQFPSIEKNETAPYIFEFINFLRSRTHNNAVFSFGKLDDIEDCLLKQWSNLFQSLLSQSKSESESSKQMIHISEQLNDMKALILSSANNETSKDVARGVLKYRSLINYVDCFLPDLELIFKQKTWDELLDLCGISGIKEFTDKENKNRVALVKTDDTFYLSSFSFGDSAYFTHKTEWPEFASLSEAVKKIIVEAVRDTTYGFKELKHYTISIHDYIEELSMSSSKKGDNDMPF